MNVLMLINTPGLDYDDRLRKEVLSLRESGCQVAIVALEYANQADEKKVYGGIEATTLRLRSRNWFPRAQGLAVKTAELYGHFLAQVLRQKPEIAWIHNLELLGLVPLLALLCRLGVIGRLIWDQHELPSDARIDNRFFMRLLAFCMNLCDAVVMANPQRYQLIQSRLEHPLRTPVYVLDNYPDRTFIETPPTGLPAEISQWLAGSDFVLAQGGASPGRYLRELAQAILSLESIKMVVIGPHQQGDLEFLDDRFGAQWRQRILFTGFVPQMDIIPFIDHALVSVVFYQITTANSRLCAPNRLYQAIGRGTPVLVGNNPPMAAVVEQWQCGVVLSDDGRNVAEIVRGLTAISTSAADLRRNAERARASMLWETQLDVFEKLLGEQHGS
ncbi:MAG: hypothetical protein KF893_01620 [Caldilineaceae bacterium]|nr:hypothetical protein [Caldilineaceae bacterium]